MYQMAKEAFSQRKLSEFLNPALIELIPKNAAKDSISGWRPITLLNVSYKILAKAIAILIQKIAAHIVRQEQTGFV